MPAGTLTRRPASLPPPSIRHTVFEASALSRLATAQPAEPAPMTIVSKARFSIAPSPRWRSLRFLIMLQKRQYLALHGNEIRLHDQIHVARAPERHGDFLADLARPARHDEDAVRQEYGF